MAAVIWNKNIHSVVDLPSELLTIVMKSLSGSELIILSEVCSGFKDHVDNFPKHKEKLAFRVANPNLAEGIEVLRSSRRDFECLSIFDVLVTEENLSEVLMGRSDWKHLKMSNSWFQTADVMVKFLSAMAETLEIIEFDQVINKNMPFSHPMRSVVLPKLRKIAAQHFQLDFVCTTLKELELRGTYNDEAMKLLQSNKVETFTLSYADIAFNFNRTFGEKLPPVCIKKLVLTDIGLQAFIGVYAACNFQAFLASQTTIEEVQMDTVGRCPNITDLQRLHESKAGTFYRRRQDLRREEFSQMFTLFLTTVLRDMKFVKKLTLSEVRQMEFPFFPSFPQNLTITELCFKMVITNNTARLVKEVIQACPNVKKLIILEFNQAIFEDCFEFMQKLESIEAHEIKLAPYASEVKLVSLRHVSYKHLESEQEYVKIRNRRDQFFYIIRHFRGSMPIF